MNFDKKPLNVQDMVNRLIDHGMYVSDFDVAVEVLTQVNYYRLSAYWTPYKELSNANVDGYVYQPGTNFDDMVMFYEFDSDLRNLISKGLEKLEITLRRHLAATLSLKYGAFPHLQPELFRDFANWHQTINAIRNEFQRSKEDYATHYKKNYPQLGLPPIWASTELATFGNLSMLLDNLADQDDRRLIAKYFNLDESVLVNFVHHFSVLRNFNAHHARMWNRVFPFPLQAPRNYFKNNSIPLNLNTNSKDRARIFNSVLVLDYLVSQIDHNFRFMESFKDLMSSYPGIPRHLMGIPSNVSI